MTRRAVLDSNVIVSGLGWSGAPARIIDAVLARELVLVTSSPLLAELRRVLAYPKLAKAIPEGSRLADLVEMSSVVVEPLTCSPLWICALRCGCGGRRGTVPWW